MNPDGIDKDADDINGDKKIGLEEAIRLLQIAAEIKEGSETRM